MSLFYKQLDTLKSSGELVQFYRDVQNSSDDLTGVLLDFNEDWVLIDCVSTSDGSDGGISVIQMQEITQTRWGSKVLKNLKFLMDELGVSKKDRLVDITSIETILNSVQELFGYVNIHFDDISDDKCYIGKVVEIDSVGDGGSGCLLLEEYPPFYSNDICHSLFRLAEITRVDAGASYEHAVNLIAVETVKG